MSDVRQPLTTQQRIALVQKKRKQEKRMYALLSIAGVAIFLLLWELASDTGIVNSRYIAPPSKINPFFIRSHHS